ncbi:MAG: quinolinate synthase NadA [Streptococcaceae bacterium]|jgi:quinolinate synthase|nr:quinolinate synthase NadA [Streptococcaceae bacterium]
MLDLKAFEKQVIPVMYDKADTADLKEIIRRQKKKLGEKLVLLAHHYQKDDIVEWADEVGDSLELAKKISKYKQAETIIFCGVHFMAETADMLAGKTQKVLLPDMSAGCSMADMASVAQLQVAWKKLEALFDGTTLPVTYINSTAEVKAFVGKHGGVTVTSGNAKEVVSWAFTKKRRILFLPDQHLGRNTAYLLGIPLKQMAMWHPATKDLSYEENLQDIRVILWEGFCSVHQQFTPLQVERMRKLFPDIKVIVHPECRRDVVDLADDFGSTAKLIKLAYKAKSGERLAIGTDNNLVERLQKEMAKKEVFIHFLNPMACACLTMNRIDLAHLAWILDELVAGRVQNQITVLDETTKWAKLTLDKMLELTK